MVGDYHKQFNKISAVILSQNFSESDSLLQANFKLYQQYINNNDEEESQKLFVVWADMTKRHANNGVYLRLHYVMLYS